MLSRRPARIGVLFAVLILALGSIGVASALWSETLTIDGTVTTGNVDVEFDVVFLNDDDPADMSFCDLGGDVNALTVTMTNAFPTYKCHMQFDVWNTGSIPVYVGQPAWAMPAEVDLIDNGCYPDGIHLEPGEYSGPCNVTFHVNDLALPGALYTFHADVYAEQVTVP